MDCMGYFMDYTGYLRILKENYVNLFFEGIV